MEILKRILFVILFVPAYILVFIMILIYPITWIITGKSMEDSYGDFPIGYLSKLVDL
jgi:ABC-type uncharacterized transport system permease subunit